MPKITVQKKGNETPDQLLMQFNKRIQGARIIKSLRSTRYHARAKSPLKQKIAALIRERHRARRTKMQYYQ